MRAMRALRTWRSLWVVTACLVSGCSARSPVPEATAGFARQFFCPAPRLAVRERRDLQVHHFACREQPAWRASEAKGEPWVDHTSPFWGLHQDALGVDCGASPPEVRVDPGRLRVFEDQQRARFRRLDGEALSILEVTGCGARQFYVCGDACTALGSADPAGAP